MLGRDGSMRNNSGKLTSCNIGNGKAARRLPDFIAVGPPRTGTTWLHGVLYHRACMPQGVKEVHFFDRFYAKGLDWYRDCFPECPEDRLVGEMTPAYFASATARERLARDIPGCKIICTFRDPTARAYSHYRKLQIGGLVRGSFAQEVDGSPEIHEASRYAFHLRAWQGLFGEQRVGVFFYDDLAARPQLFVDEVCDFIGVKRLELTPEVSRFLDRNEVRRASRNRTLARAARNLMFWLQSRRAYRAIDTLRRTGLWQLCSRNGEEFPELNPELEERTRERFLPEVEALEKLVGRDLSSWKPRRARARMAASQG